MSAKKKTTRRPAATVAPLPSRAAAAPRGDRWRPCLLAATVAVFVARPLLPIESKSLVDSGDGLPFVMLECLLAGLWAVHGLLARRLVIRWGWTDWAVLGLIVWHSASGVWGMYHGAPRPALNVLWEWVGMGLGFFLVRQLLLPGREARAVLAVMAALALGHAVYGLYQHFYSLPETRRIYQADPEAALREAGMPLLREGSPERKQFEDRLLYSEDAPFSTFSLANSLAGYLAAWLIVTLAIAVAMWKDWGLRHWAFWGAIIGLVAEGLCLYLTNSRTAVLATLVGGAACWLLWARAGQRGRWKWALGAGGALVLVIVVTVLAGVGDDLLLGAGESLGYRLEYWRASWTMIADYPLFGVGPGNFQARYTFYKLPQSKEEIQDPHNFLIEAWATAGTPAALLLVAALALFAWESMRSARGQVEGTVRDAGGYIAAGGLAGFGLAWLFGLLATTGPITEGLVVILPSAVVGLAVLWAWVQEGRLARGLPLLGALVLVVNLSAAGGMGFPGVAGSLWLLLAVGLTEAEDRPPTSVGRGTAAGVLALLVVMGVACYMTAFRPVLVCQASVHRALQDPRNARQHLAAAAAADPWSSEPWFALAGLQLARWKEDRSEESFAEFERLLQHGLDLNPYSSSAWLQAGQWCREAYQASQDRRLASLAAGKYQRAKDLYPASPLHWALFALALADAGDGTAAAAKAETIRLHTQAHPDKKLPDELLRELDRIP